jgi:hypothetical protein
MGLGPREVILGDLTDLGLWDVSAALRLGVTLAGGVL